MPSLDEAGASLTRDLVRYCGTDSWHFVGLADNELLIYTQTRKRANELVSFVGRTYQGFPVRGVSLGKVRIVAR